MQAVETSPWTFVPAAILLLKETTSGLASGWFTLGGAIIGGGVSLITTLFVLRNTNKIEQAKREREDRTRYNLERAEAYSTFLALVNNLPNILPVAAKARTAIKASEFTKLRDELWRAYIKTDLLATKPVRAAARTLFQDAVEYIIEQDEAKRQAIRQAVRDASLAQRFVEAAQEELGVDAMFSKKSLSSR